MESKEIVAALRSLGLVAENEAIRLAPLAGGVSSDIYFVETDDRCFCVKRALTRLRVAAVWEAPLRRNAAEAAWIRCVGRWLPRAVPEVLGEDVELGLFAMSYLPPETNPVWKAELLKGVVDLEFAAAVGRDLAVIHAKSAADPSIPAAFSNDAIFESIRIDPYLRAAGRAHPDLAGCFDLLAEATLATKRALAHGDVSPKNILRGAEGPIFLDAECANFGDPAFDLAFCLNHLMLKGARKGAARDAYGEAFRRLKDAYLSGVAWEAPADVEARAAALLPALLLARVDGKSPVEYLTGGAEKDGVRRFAIPFIVQPVSRLADIIGPWSAA